MGGRGSGKTSLVSRLITGKWEATNPTTTFLDRQSTSMNVRGKQYQIVTCDYAGSSEYRLIQKTMFPPTKSVPVKCMLTIDLSRIESLNELIRIIDDLVVPRLSGRNSPVSYLLVGCKADLKRNVSNAEAANLAKVISQKVGKTTQYVETSAKDGKGVVEAFGSLI